MGGAERRTPQTSFSVAKSFLSTLVGIAIHEGSIGGLDDPVTEYVPRPFLLPSAGVERPAFRGQRMTCE